MAVYNESPVSYVGPKDDIQSALTAKGTVATIDKPQIVADAGAIATAPLNIPANVTYSPQVASSSRFDIGRRIPNAQPPDLFSIPVNTALVALISFDGYGSNGAVGGWTLASATLGGLTPLQYIADLGIPVGHSIIPKKIIDGIAGFMTVAELRSAFLQAGCELTAQSYGHEVLTSEQLLAQHIRETLSAREWIESMATALYSDAIETPTLDTTYAGCQPVGAVVNGWNSPGDWKSSVDGANADGSVKNAWGKNIADIYANIFNYIAQAYSWSLSCLGNVSYRKARQGAGVRHCGSWTGGMDLNTAAINTDYLATPGSRFIFAMDSPTEATMAQFKSNVDALATARNAGKFMVVNVNTIFNGLNCGPWSATDHRSFNDSTGLDIAGGYVGGVNNGNWAGFTAGAVNSGVALPSTQASGWQGEVTAGDAKIETSGGVKWLRLKVDKYVIEEKDLVPGAQYLLRIVARSHTAGQNAVLQVKPRHHYGNSALDKRIRTPLRTKTLSNDWATHYRAFAVPSWSVATYLQYASTVGDVDIHSIELIRIG